MSTITCTKFEAISGTKRCKNYLPNGSCKRPDEFMCVEWLKLNGRSTVALQAPRTAYGVLDGSEVAAVPKASSGASHGPAKAKSSVPQIFGPPRPVAAPSAAASQSPQSPQSQPMAAFATAADIASFKSRGIEVCFTTSELGDVWIVPEYTGARRQELSIEHAALIASACSAFPGAKLKAIQSRK